MNSNSSHSLTIIDRSTINISGVNKIESFDKEEFLLETVMGYMNIKGEALEMIKLDTIEGKVVIKGKINSLVYLENRKIMMKISLRNYLNDIIRNTIKINCFFFFIWCLFFNLIKYKL